MTSVQAVLRKTPKAAGQSTVGVVTRMTKKAWGLSVVPALLVLYLVSMSIRYNSLFAFEDGSRWTFVLLPLLVAVMIAGAMAKVAFSYVGVKITLTPTHLSVEPRKESQQFQVAWKSLIYTQNNSFGRLVRVLQVGGNEGSTFVFDFFTPGFDFLCKEVAKRKTYSISADSMGNMVIDSTKLGRI